jgi:hypothetical protein
LDTSWGTTIFWPCPQFTEDVKLVLTGSVKTIDLPGGRQIGPGPNLRVTATAPNGQTASYVITGATHLTVLKDANGDVTELDYIATGLNLPLVPEANGHPSGLFLTVGTWSFALNPDGTEKTPLSGTGTILDVCIAGENWTRIVHRAAAWCDGIRGWRSVPTPKPMPQRL